MTLHVNIELHCTFSLFLIIKLSSESSTPFIGERLKIRRTFGDLLIDCKFTNQVQIRGNFSQGVWSLAFDCDFLVAHKSPIHLSDRCRRDWSLVEQNVLFLRKPLGPQFFQQQCLGRISGEGTDTILECSESSGEFLRAVGPSLLTKSSSY